MIHLEEDSSEKVKHGVFVQPLGAVRGVVWVLSPARRAVTVAAGPAKTGTSRRDPGGHCKSLRQWQQGQQWWRCGSCKTSAPKLVHLMSKLVY